MYNNIKNTFIYKYVDFIVDFFKVFHIYMLFLFIYKIYVTYMELGHIAVNSPSLHAFIK